MAQNNQRKGIILYHGPVKKLQIAGHDSNQTLSAYITKQIANRVRQQVEQSGQRKKKPDVMQHKS